MSTVKASLQMKDQIDGDLSGDDPELLCQRMKSTIRTHQVGVLCGRPELVTASLSLEDFSMGDEAMTDANFEQQCKDVRERVLARRPKATCKDWICKLCDTHNRVWREVCFNQDCQSSKAESGKAVAAVRLVTKQTVDHMQAAEGQQGAEQEEAEGLICLRSPTGAEGTSRLADCMPTSSSSAVKAKAARCKSCHKPWASCLCRHALMHENLVMHMSAQEKQTMTSLLEISSRGTTRTTAMMTETEEQTVSEKSTVPDLLYSNSDSSRCGMSDVGMTPDSMCVAGDTTASDDYKLRCFRIPMRLSDQRMRRIPKLFLPLRTCGRQQKSEKRLRAKKMDRSSQ